MSSSVLTHQSVIFNYQMRAVGIGPTRRKDVYLVSIALPEGFNVIGKTEQEISTELNPELRVELEKEKI